MRKDSFWHGSFWGSRFPQFTPSARSALGPCIGCAALTMIVPAPVVFPPICGRCPLGFRHGLHLVRFAASPQVLSSQGSFRSACEGARATRSDMFAVHALPEISCLRAVCTCATGAPVVAGKESKGLSPAPFGCPRCLRTPCLQYRPGLSRLDVVECGQSLANLPQKCKFVRSSFIRAGACVVLGVSCAQSVNVRQWKYRVEGLAAYGGMSAA